MTKIASIKRAQKASLLLRTISQLFLEAVRDNPKLQGLTITRIELSPDKSSVYVFFYTDEGSEKFKALLQDLKLYKPSLRASIARSIASRYTPEITFKFDDSFEKIQRIEHLLDSLKPKESDDTHDTE